MSDSETVSICYSKQGFKEERNKFSEKLQTMSSIDLIGRCNSSGSNIKYSTHAMLPTNEVIDFKIIHVSQVSSSNGMKKHGFLKLLKVLEKENISVWLVTTDRHIGIRAYLSKERQNIKNQSEIKVDCQSSLVVTA